MIFSIDFMFLNVVTLAATTILVSYIQVLYTILFVMISSFIILNDSLNTKLNPAIRKKFNFFELPNKVLPARREAITIWRANILIATTLNILAVDFPVYPRRFCKVETYGMGLMDVGVGCFIMSNAVVSAEARKECSR